MGQLGRDRFRPISDIRILRFDAAKRSLEAQGSAVLRCTIVTGNRGLDEAHYKQRRKDGHGIDRSIRSLLVRNRVGNGGCRPRRRCDSDVQAQKHLVSQPRQGRDGHVRLHWPYDGRRNVSFFAYQSAVFQWYVDHPPAPVGT